MFRASRERPAEPDRFLDLKIALFLAGAVFGIAGMVRGSRSLILIAMLIIGAGIVLRFVGRRGAASEERDIGEDSDNAAPL